MVAYPDKTFKEICHFLHVDYEPKMLTEKQNSTIIIDSPFSERIENMHADSSQPIHTNKIGTWKETLSNKEVIELSCFCSKTARKFNYQDIPDIKLLRKVFTWIKYAPKLSYLLLLTSLKKQSYHLSLKKSEKTG